MPKLIDMAGWNMWEHGVPDSRLSVIERGDDYISPGGNRYTQWICRCNCKDRNLIIARGEDIRSGNTLSCGCLQREKASSVGKSKHKENKYDLSGEYGVGWTSNTNNEFYFDLEDYDKIKNYCWRECVDQTDYHYLVARKCGEKNKMIKITDIVVGKHYDHKNHNTLDNRKENLRPATPSENAQNKSIQKNNTSGVIGVSYDKSCNKWRAYIRDNKKAKYVGYCDNKNDAIIARLEAEAKYYGEFAPQKHLFEQYKININGGDNQ